MKRLLRNSLILLLFSSVYIISGGADEIDEALVLEHSGDTKGALEYYRLWLYEAGHKDNPVSQYSDILIHSTGLLESTDKSLSFLEQCLSQNPGKIPRKMILKSMADLYIMQGKYKEGSRLYIEASGIDENRLDYGLLLLGYQLSYKSGDYSYLEDLKGPMSRTSGELLTRYSNLHALTLYQLGYSENALRLLQRLLKVDNFAPNTEFHMVMLFLLEQNGEKTEPYLKSLTKREQNSLELQIYKGNISRLYSPGDIIPPSPFPD